MRKELKILHLATDDKFIDQAIRLFERETPGQNFLYVNSPGKPKHIKSNIDRQVSRADTRTGRLAVDAAGYDLVVVHSLDSAWWKTLLALPKELPVLWLGWGYDYYDLLATDRSDLLLPATRACAGGGQFGEGLVIRLKRQLKSLLFGVDKKRVVERVDYFAPVLSEEYGLLRGTADWRRFPQQAVWNYGSLEEDLVRGFLDGRVTGHNVLVGNSATLTNNHIDLFKALSGQAASQRKIIVPLSYGNPVYREIVLKEGERAFGEAFFPLVDFMPLEQYVQTLLSCGFAVMNHVRQQALGNIIILLYLGAKVFLRQESPVYEYFRKQGMVLFTVQELEKDFGMLNEGLDLASMEANRQLIIQHWSAPVARQKTLRLLEQILGPDSSDSGH